MKWGLVLPLAALGVAGDAPLQPPLDPCSRHEDGVIYSRPYRECVALLPPERLRGTWFFGLEESSFLPEGAALPAERVFDFVEDRFPPETETHLDAGWPEVLELLEGVPEPEGEGDTYRYAVEFIGRRSRFAGEFGHGGFSSRLIVLDRMISIRPAGRVRTRIRMRGLDCEVGRCPSTYSPPQSAPPGNSSAL